MFKRWLRRIVFTLLGLVALLGLYVATAFALVLWPANAKPSAGAPAEIQAWVLSNGVHTDYVFPIRSATVDWLQVFPLKVPGVGRVDVFVPVKPPAPDGIATLEIVLLDEETLTIVADRILLGGQGTMHLEGNVAVTLPSGSQIRGRHADVMRSGPGADGKRRISIQLPRGN